MSKVYFFIAGFIMLFTSTFSQGGGKYADAYKKYLNASCPITKDSIQHFVYFARDREAIIVHPFLTHPMFKAAQAIYT